MAHRKKIIAGNWKMNLSRSESLNLARGLADVDHDTDSTTMLVFPALAWVASVADAVAGSNVAVGGQNCYFEKAGAFTGEVSAGMLAEVCSYGLAGHSERRHVFGESNADVAAKVRAILDAGMTVVLCVGETIEEREAGTAEDVVGEQLAQGIQHVAEDEIERVVIAYEPVWAIGTGVSATPDDAQAMCQFVRARLADSWSEMADQVPVLYGGSVTADNALELFQQADIDGGLVGGASLNVQSFRAIVEASQRV
jgi:triosephosphate isomerase (TIM)